MNDITTLMITTSRIALKNAYSPYSKYSVSSCICTDDNVLFTGVNVENCSYGLTICAETSAICQMIAGGHQRIKSMVILAGDHALCPPCGACRQRIHEFSTPDTLIHLCNQQDILKTMTIDELLPMAFSLKGSQHE